MVGDLWREVRVLMRAVAALCLVLYAAAATAACSDPPAVDASAPPPVSSDARTPVRETEPVAHDPDDPAIWVSASNPARSLILATDKIEEQGGLYVFGLDGTLKQTIAPLDRPNNVDIEYGFAFGGQRIDIAVLTERMQHRLRVFGIPADGGPLMDLAPAGLPVLEGEAGERQEPMGIALYKRPRDGVVFAIISPKTGGTENYLWQYRLDSDGRGVSATLVRRFGAFSGIGASADEAGEIEAIVVDDPLGYVYYSDERFGIRKWRADPDAADAARELAIFGIDAYSGDREGLALYQHPGGTGYIVSSDQIEGATRLLVYRREGDAGDPHAHQALATLSTMADETDGLDVTSQALPGFPRGLLVMMNSAARNFQIYRWEDVAPPTDRTN